MVPRIDLIIFKLQTRHNIHPFYTLRLFQYHLYIYLYKTLCVKAATAQRVRFSCAARAAHRILEFISYFGSVNPWNATISQVQHLAYKYALASRSLLKLSTKRVPRKSGRESSLSSASPARTQALKSLLLCYSGVKSLSEEGRFNWNIRMIINSQYNPITHPHRNCRFRTSVLWTFHSKGCGYMYIFKKVCKYGPFTNLLFCSLGFFSNWFRFLLRL